MPARIEENVTYAGDVTVIGTLTMPDGTITNAKVNSGADVAHTKLEHQHRIPYAQPNTAATAETRVVYRCYGASGVVLSVHVGSIAKAVGDAVATVDVKKNGTTILSAPVTLNSSNTNRVAVAATLSVTTLAAGDVLEVVTTATIGTGTLPTGVFASINVSEKAA